MKFKPLDDNLAELLAELSNRVLDNDLKEVTPDGIKTLYVKPIQVQAVFKALSLYNLAIKKLEKKKS